MKLGGGVVSGIMLGGSVFIAMMIILGIIYLIAWITTAIIGSDFNIGPYLFYIWMGSTGLATLLGFIVDDKEVLRNDKK